MLELLQTRASEQEHATRPRTRTSVADGASLAIAKRLAMSQKKAALAEAAGDGDEKGDQAALAEWATPA